MVGHRYSPIRDILIAFGRGGHKNLTKYRALKSLTLGNISAPVYFYLVKKQIF